MYNNYEAYMKESLGYPYNYFSDNYNNTYVQEQRNYQNTSEVEKFYPEIYKIVRPMVINTCGMYSNQNITEDVLEEMTMKIYMTIETNEKRSTETEKPLKNGDVINPNAKREIKEDRGIKPTNYLLKDLIKILLIFELKNNNHNRPPMMPPILPQRPCEFCPPYGNCPDGVPPYMRQF